MNDCKQCKELAVLLLECRDALPAISQTSARLHGVSLTLADRIEAALEPWRITENEGTVTKEGWHSLGERGSIEYERRFGSC